MKPDYSDRMYIDPTMDSVNIVNNNSLPSELNSKCDEETTAKSTDLKRKFEQDLVVSSPKKLKKESVDVVPTLKPKTQIKKESVAIVPTIKPHANPKKRINVAPAPESKNRFIYGNYNRYYGYRNQKEVHDIRLDVFQAHKELFAGKEVLDIGCNCGFLTMEIAKALGVKHITGLDIDKGLVNKVIKHIGKTKKAVTSGDRVGFPFNVTFVHGNYVLRDDVLLEIESPQFDLILCLSVTKWIHLNFGDNALKQTFRRMYAQLREGGRLILEPQPWDGYKRRKKLTPEIFKNYQSIVFRPKDFTDYLLSKEVGFKSVSLLAVPDHCAAGFRRPIQVFCK